MYTQERIVKLLISLYAMYCQGFILEEHEEDIVLLYNSIKTRLDSSLYPCR